MNPSSMHQFHIPVMGLAYTIDTPIKVAPFGISSVISIVEDRLIETMRKHYYEQTGRPYLAIGTQEPDYRCRRISDYLNLVHQIVEDRIRKIKRSAFEKGTAITRYFEMLPASAQPARLYQQMMAMTEGPGKSGLQEKLRELVVAGSIDVNIMTKVDRDTQDRNGNIIPEGSDAVTALRGYVNSNLSQSSVVFSAGMNPRLFNYLENCPAFDIAEDGSFGKKITLKVSDYRSALVQGKYLAKKGLWVSEFRIESGLNCGGHAFPTEGMLMGPILQEFRDRREELIHDIFTIYNESLYRKHKKRFKYPPALRFTAQGGIGTHSEQEFLRSHYQLDSTGWGSPFLLVPEATTVDEETLLLLAAAGQEDIVLSRSSPLGVRFHYLRGTSAERERLQRIRKGRPGSPCTEKHLAFNTEFTKEPICTASRQYQRLKIESLKSANLEEKEYRLQVGEVLEKECLCVGLSTAAGQVHHEPFLKNRDAVTICPGPNIAHFSRVVSLKTMVDHIYGRKNILTATDRPHMFIKELQLYIDYLSEQLRKGTSASGFEKAKPGWAKFSANLREGIRYYRHLSALAKDTGGDFGKALDDASLEIDLLEYQYSLT